MNNWAKAALVRAVRTAAHTALPSVPASLFGVDWKVLVGIMGGSVLASFLHSLAGLPEVAGEEPVEEPSEDTEE
jgi:hypothetical protein